MSRLASTPPAFAPGEHFACLLDSMDTATPESTHSGLCSPFAPYTVTLLHSFHVAHLDVLLVEDVDGQHMSHVGQLTRRSRASGKDGMVMETQIRSKEGDEDIASHGKGLMVVGESNWQTQSFPLLSA